MVEKTYNTKELAEALRVSPDTATKYCRDGAIKAIKQHGGSYLVTETALNAYLSGKDAPLPSEGSAVQKAKDAAEIAEARQREAQAKTETEALQLNMTVEQYIDTVTNVQRAKKELEEREARYNDEIAEAVKEEKQKYIEKAKEAEADRNAYHETDKRLKNENATLKSKLANADKEIRNLSQQLGDKLEKDVEMQDDISYFITHNDIGITLLNQSLKLLITQNAFTEVRKSIIYLQRVANWIPTHKESNKMQAVYETSMEAYRNAGIAINGDAMICQDKNMKGSGIFGFMNSDKTDYQALFQALCDISDRIEKTMDFSSFPKDDNPDHSHIPDRIPEESNNG